MTFNQMNESTKKAKGELMFEKMLKKAEMWFARKAAKRTAKIFINEMRRIADGVEGDTEERKKVREEKRIRNIIKNVVLSALSIGICILIKSYTDSVSDLQLIGILLCILVFFKIILRNK